MASANDTPDQVERLDPVTITLCRHQQCPVLPDGRQIPLKLPPVDTLLVVGNERPEGVAYTSDRARCLTMPDTSKISQPAMVSGAILALSPEFLQSLTRSLLRLISADPHPRPRKWPTSLTPSAAHNMLTMVSIPRDDFDTNLESCIEILLAWGAYAPYGGAGATISVDM
ncbi:hypothetical protein BDN67DRAFT_978550 [Paxillus ammoniavirescens]|nr:hypothetical protein BDN67DRAFT_978550 [Paxillus ammoniavirescens]